MLAQNMLYYKRVLVNIKLCLRGFLEVTIKSIYGGEITIDQ
jgi:hypothetical protein